MVSIAALQPSEVAYVDQRLPLSRLDQQIEKGSTYPAEQEARARGCESISLSASQDGNVAARSLYAKLGYVDVGVDPVRVSGTIIVRGRPLDVDDTLVYLTKSL